MVFCNGQLLLIQLSPQGRQETPHQAHRAHRTEINIVKHIQKMVLGFYKQELTLNKRLGRNDKGAKCPVRQVTRHYRYLHVYSQRRMRGAVFRDIESPILRVPCITLV